MINLTERVIFVLTIIVYATAAAEYVNAGMEKRYYTDPTCYPPDGYEYYELEPRICMNRQVNYGNGPKFEFIHDEIATVTCVHSPQSQVKIKYYEKEDNVYKQVLESVDKGRVLAHIRLNRERSSHVICESNDTGLIQQVKVFLNPNNYNNHLYNSIINDLPYKGYESLGSVRFAYFANHRESKTVQICTSYNYICNITPGYQTDNKDFGTAKNGVFTFDNSSESKSISCVVPNTRLQINVLPYSQMSSTLTSDFIFVRGLKWNRMTNTYVRRDLNRYNFIYTYHYTEEELKLTCVSKTRPTWKYLDNKSITINGEVNYYSGENAYFGEITFKFNDGFDDTAIYCSSTSGNTASVILHRYNHANGYKGYLTALKMYISTNNNYLKALKNVLYKGHKGLSIVRIQNNGTKTTTDPTPTEACNNETLTENSVACLDEDVREKLTLSDQEFGEFIGLQLAYVPLNERRSYMYKIIKTINDNA